MAVNTLKLSALRGLSESAKAERIAKFAAASRTPVNGELADIDARILAYENRYERTTEGMLAALADGSLHETDDICGWVMLLKLRDGIRGAAPTAQPCT